MASNAVLEVSPGRSRPSWLAASGLAVPIIAWAAADLRLEESPSAVLASVPAQAIETASATAGFFGALAIFLIHSVRLGNRAPWLASGLAMLSLAQLILGHPVSAPGSLPYVWLAAQTAAGLMFAVALFPKEPPGLSWRSGLLVLLASILPGLLASGAFGLVLTALPPDPPSSATMPHDLQEWLLTSLPLILAIPGVWGALRWRGDDTPAAGTWLAGAMVLFAGSHLHDLFHPTIHSSTLVASDLLRLLFTTVMAAGGLLTLRDPLSRPAGVLPRDCELARARADFIAMVAHELGAPLATIRGAADLVLNGGLDERTAQDALRMVTRETELVGVLLDDVQTAAALGRVRFEVRLRPIRLDGLLADAVAFSSALPGDHPLVVSSSCGAACVRADPERVRQVLRNLLVNASRYAPAGTPICLRARHEAERMCIEVADAGAGIHADDLEHIFEIFGRGRNAGSRTTGAFGLGLYVSRCILQLHGSDLTVRCDPSSGTTFAFDLEVVRCSE